ncbi:hypothetical protein NFI96_023097 [Prochilodus magdalenae]|nr:hypothetical protein NFI96_023097 [Prochilodus magdalenae]
MTVANALISVPLDSIVYICSGLAIMVIILLLATTALLKQRKDPKSPKESPAELFPLRMTPAGPGEDDIIYQEIEEKEEPKPAMESTVNTIYCTAEGPADAPVYSTIDEPTSSTIYSTATLPEQSPNDPTDPTDDAPVYSLMTHSQ